MRKFFALSVILTLLLTGYCGASLGLETIRFPTEDELAEALALGDIEIEQYFILLELITNGIDSTSLYLLDEIPHVFKKDEQIESFINPKPKGIQVRQQYSSYIKEHTVSKYQTSLRYSKNNIDSELRLRREFSGKERIVRRFVRGTHLSQNLNELIIGNFSKRFGLGTVIGYRGKLVSFSGEIDNESLLYPDYGGFNGLYSNWHLRSLELESIHSYNQDSGHSLFTNSISFSKTGNAIPYSFIIGVNRIRNRFTDQALMDFKTSVYSSRRFADGLLSAELAYNRYESKNAFAFVSECDHTFSPVKSSLSFWHYSDDYLDVSGGSKTSLISEKVILPELDFKFSSKRVDQTGMMLKSKINFDDRTESELSFLYSNKNSDTTEFQLFSRLTRFVEHSLSLSADILYRKKIRYENPDNAPFTKTEVRLAAKYQNKSLYLRSFVSYQEKNYEDNCIGIFSEAKFKSDQFDVIHCWINLARFDFERSRTDYFYFFVKNEYHINSNMQIGFKVTHRYNRNAVDKTINQFTFDMSYRL